MQTNNNIDNKQDKLKMIGNVLRPSERFVAYQRYGRLCYLHVSWYDTRTSDGTIIITLPENVRPTLTLQIRNGFDNQNGEIVVYDSGEIIYQSNIGDAYYCAIDVCYFCQQE